MDDQMLKILIQSACQEGSINDSDKEIIYRKAQQIGISKEKVDKLISEELQKNIDEDNESGFIPMEEMQEKHVESNNSLISSITDQTKFSDLKPLSYQGAMSLVYQAKLYGKWIIIKRIKPEFKNNEKYKELFIREFENAYHLDHPHIVRLLDRGEDEEGLYYTMEYIDGRPLSEMLNGNGLKNDRLSEKISRQIVDALYYVHKKQIFHRDLKPDNIYVTYRGDNVKILDFGLAAADNFEDNLAKAGTPRYASPEQMDANMAIDQRSDIYSFGKIFLEMLTGDTKIDALDSVSNKTHKYIVEKSLKENRNERFDDCDEILDVFKNPGLIPKDYFDEKKSVKKTPKPPKVKKTKTKNKFMIPVILGVVLIAAVSAFYFLFLKKDSNNILPKAKTENLIAKADSLFNVGEFVDANDVYVSITKKTEHVDNQINLLADLLADFDAANKVFDGKNIARSLEMYKKIVSEYPNFGEVTKKIDECNLIIKNANFNNLQVVPESSTNKLGFADSKGNVIIDYQFDKVAPLKDWHKKGLIPVQISGKYGFIDRNKNYFAKCIYSGSINGGYVWLPSGYRVTKDGRNVSVVIDENGNGVVR